MLFGFLLFSYKLSQERLSYQALEIKMKVSEIQNTEANLGVFLSGLKGPRREQAKKNGLYFIENVTEPGEC